MAEQKDRDDAAEQVAPGYPAAEALKKIDVSDWEPAAVFRPVDSPEYSSEGSDR